MCKFFLLLLFPLSTFGGWVPPNMIYFPVQIEIGASSGSGFFISTSNRLFLATAKHVLFDINSPARPLPAHGTNLQASSWSAKGRGSVTYNFGHYLTNNEVKYSESRDVAIVHICDLVGTNGNPGYQLDFVSASTNWRPASFPLDAHRRIDTVPVAEDVFTFGYPTSIGSQIPGNVQLDRTRPLARRGIIADVDLQRKALVVDMPVYFGNSGGPVLAIDSPELGQTRATIVGIVSQFVPFEDVWISQRYKLPNVSWSNSGYGIVEPIDFILDLIW